MSDSFVQLIPELISLQTNAKKINCFSFWDKNNNKEFFQPDQNSRLSIKYFVNKNIELPPQKPTLQFSNYSYDDEKWYFRSGYKGLDFSFVIDEKNTTVFCNYLCHKLFIKISWIEPIGYILTDYINYLLEKEKMSYHAGAAARINNKTFLFFGFGRNFKTTMVNMILYNNGFYIGEEFIFLNGGLVYSTIPNSHRFDFRESHKSLMNLDINKRKIDKSEYDVVIFLIYSKKNEIIEIDLNKANIYAQEFNQHFNSSYFYGYIKAKDFLLGKKIGPKENILKSKKARFFIIYFTDVQNAFKFVNEFR